MPDSIPEHTPNTRRKGRFKPKGRLVQQDNLKALEQLLPPASEMRRDMLIEYLHIIQDHAGHLSAGDLAALAHMMRLPMAEVWEVASFYDHFTLVKEGEMPPPQRTVRVCTSLSCMMAGSTEMLAELQKNSPDDVRFVPAPCLGACDKAPAVADGHHLTEARDTAALSALVSRPAHHQPLTSHIGFEDYQAQGGYSLARQLSDGSANPENLLESLDKSALRGLGGAGFPTGRKWKIVASQPAPRFLAVNGDEGEPGTFKDRFYLSTDPHRMLEGILIAAHLVSISKCYIYLRDEYPEIRDMLIAELDLLKASGLSDHVDIELRRGAGAYICGEESAMIESIEGKRGLPRHRPPYVAERGLFGRPTLVNNVETLFWVRDILEQGPDWFNEQGKEGHPGFRTYSVSGRVARPGLVKAAAGSTVAELIEACGGMAEGHEFKAYLPGGASGGILPAGKADLPLDFGGALAAEGCFVGSHAVVVLSQQDDMWQAAENLLEFFTHESCGQCTPCRSGTIKAVEEMARPAPNTEILGQLASTMADASICGLGQAASNPLLSVMKHFPQEVPSQTHPKAEPESGES